MASIKCGHCTGYHESVADVRLCSTAGNGGTPLPSVTRYEMGKPVYHAKRRGADAQAASAPKSPQEGSHFCRASVRKTSPTFLEVCGAPVEFTAGGDAVHVLRRIDADHPAKAETIGQANRRAKGLPMQDAEKDAKRPYREPVGEGFYKLGTQIFKVQKNLRGTGVYAKVLTVEETGDIGNPEYSGSWTYARGAIRNLRPEHKLTKEQAAEFGKLYGVCCVCGRRLTNEESIEAGIGPVCAGKQGW